MVKMLLKTIEKSFIKETAIRSEELLLCMIMMKLPATYYYLLKAYTLFTFL